MLQYNKEYITKAENIATILESYACSKDNYRLKIVKRD